MQRIPTDRLTGPDHVARWGISARHHDRHLSAPSGTQYQQYSSRHTVPHVRYQFPPGNRRSTGSPEIFSAVPQLLGPAVRQESPSEPGTGIRIQTYWHEDLQVRRAVPSSGPGESASPMKERKRDTLRKKLKNAIRVVKDLGNPSHKQDSGDKDRREKIRRSISSPV